MTTTSWIRSYQVLLLLRQGRGKLEADLASAQTTRHVDEAKIGDDGATVLQENVLGLEILVDDALVVEIAHALGDLLSNDEDLVHWKLVLSQMQVGEEGVA